MFRIGEFSKLTQVSIRMLRYYDEMNLLKPAQIDRFTNYRYYSAEQIPILHKIVFLRDLGCSISEISSLVKNWNSEQVKSHLIEKEAELWQEIQKEEERLRKIRYAIEHIYEDQDDNRYNFSIQQIPEYFVISLRRVVSDYFAEESLWLDLGEFMRAHQIKPLSNIENITVFHDEEERDIDVDIEVCAHVGKEQYFEIKDNKEVQFRTLPVIAEMACAFVWGPFENIDGAYYSFAKWLTEHTDYLMKGSRQICHKGPWNEADPEKYLTQMQIELIKKVDSTIV